MTADRPFYIYCHTAPNGKRYIGQTCLRPELRWNNGRGYDSCTLMHRAIEKYGWDNFRHDILCVVHSRKVADLFEQYYIETYDTFNEEHGYNLTKGGAGVVGYEWDEDRKREHSEKVSGSNNGMYGRKHSEKSKALMSEKLKGRMSEDMRKEKAKLILEQVEKQKMPVDQYDLQGNFIATHPSLSDAARSVGVTESSIHRCCSGKGDTAAGYKWTYHGKELVERVKKPRARSGPSGVPIVQYDLNGNEVARFSSMTDAGKKTGLNRNKIAECCHGGLQEYAGYRWSFGSEVRSKGIKTPVIQFDLDGNEIARFNTLEEASAATGAQRNRISACCRGKAKSANGFVFKYVDESAANLKLGQPNAVIQFDTDGNEIARYKSLTDAMEATGQDRSRIAECCKGILESYRGTKWQYVGAA